MKALSVCNAQVKVTVWENLFRRLTESSPPVCIFNKFCVTKSFSVSLLE